MITTHPDYQQIRDRVLGSLKLGKQAPRYKQSKQLLDQFIEELPALPTPSTPVSTPDIEQIMEWVNYAMEDLNKGEVENAKRSLTQAIRIARGEGENDQ